MNDSIAFQDLSLSIDNNKIKTNQYQKPTCSGSVLNYHSNHIIQLKRNIVWNLIDRAFLLAHESFYNTNMEIVKNILMDNDYPESFIY